MLVTSITHVKVTTVDEWVLRWDDYFILLLLLIRLFLMRYIILTICINYDYGVVLNLFRPGHYGIIALAEKGIYRCVKSSMFLCRHYFFVEYFDCSLKKHKSSLWCGYVANLRVTHNLASYRNFYNVNPRNGWAYFLLTRHSVNDFFLKSLCDRCRRNNGAVLITVISEPNAFS